MIGLFCHFQASEEGGLNALGDGDFHLVDAAALVGDDDTGPAGDGEGRPGAVSESGAVLKGLGAVCRRGVSAEEGEDKVCT